MDPRKLAGANANEGMASPPLLLWEIRRAGDLRVLPQGRKWMGPRRRSPHAQLISTFGSVLASRNFKPSCLGRRSPVLGAFSTSDRELGNPKQVPGLNSSALRFFLLTMTPA